MRIGAHRDAFVRSQEAPAAMRTVSRRQPETVWTRHGGLIGAAIGGTVMTVLFTRHCEHECGLAALLGMSVGLPVGYMIGTVVADEGNRPRRGGSPYPD